MKLGITLLPSPVGKGDRRLAAVDEGKRRMHFVSNNFGSSGILH